MLFLLLFILERSSGPYIVLAHGYSIQVALENIQQVPYILLMAYQSDMSTEEEHDIAPQRSHPMGISANML